MCSSSEKANASYIPEMLETPLGLKPLKKVEERKEPKKSVVKKKSLDQPITLFKSIIANDYVQLDKSDWPFFSGCDAVFECTPHLERDNNRFKDGVFFVCAKIKQDGIYKGVFIERDRARLYIYEGETSVADSSKGNMEGIIYHRIYKFNIVI